MAEFSHVKGNSSANAWCPDDTRTIATKHVRRVGGVLQALRDVVAERGHVDVSDRRVIADVFNLSEAEVRGIVSFYHDLKTKPQPPHTVKVCQAEACQAVGGRALTRDVEAALALALGEANSRVALEPIYCFGLCAQGPAMAVDDRLIARADQQALDRVLP